MAENADFICRQITQYIAERLKIDAEFINDIRLPAVARRDKVNPT
jgi:hypothetical protein